MEFCGYQTSCWELWANIATVITGLTTIFGMIVIVFTLLATKNQLNEMNKSRSITSFFEAYNLFETKESLELRLFLYDLSVDPSELIEEQREKFALLMTHLNVVAYLVRKNFIQPDDFLGLYWHRTLTLWMKSESYVEYERTRRQDPTWASDLEWLAKEAEDYHRENFPSIEISLFKRGEEQVENAV